MILLLKIAFNDGNDIMTSLQKKHDQHKPKFLLHFFFFFECVIYLKLKT